MSSDTEQGSNSKDMVSGGSSGPVFSKEDMENLNAYREQQEIRFAATKRIVFLVFIVFLVGFLLFMVSTTNPGIYEVSEENLLFINHGYNALILLAIPFLLGILGAVARLLLSGVKVGDEFSLIIGSGLMASFSWVGIKSGVFLAIIAPHVERQGISPSSVIGAPSDFYTMVLVAVFVGMFSTNLYLYIGQRIDQLSNNSEKKEG